MIDIGREPRPAKPLRRAREGRLLGGVCAGLASAFTVDVTLVRLAFLVLSIAWGLGLLVYVALWLVMPHNEERLGGGIRETLRRRVSSTRGDLIGAGERLRDSWKRVDRRPWPIPLGRRWVAILLIAVGGGVLLASLGAFGWLTPMRAIGLATIVVGAGILVQLQSPQG